MKNVSSNAGKHPYRRSDFVSPYTVTYDKPGIKLIPITAKFKTIIETDYQDKKGKRIYFKDVIIYDEQEYIIDYNAKEFFWIAVSLKNESKTLKLSKIARKSTIKISYNKK